MKPPTSKPYNKIIAFFGVLLVLLGLIGLWQRDYIADWLRVSQYAPSAAIVAITDQVRFTDKGRFYFYASQPSLDGTQSFVERCGKHERSTNIIGCYVNNNIYLYDVKNDELAGIEEVTAAHEMLHAAYDRLSASQRQQLDNLLEAEARKHLDDELFTERMKVYDDLSRSDKVHEYHSVFGTEVRDISPELEKHYAEYFRDREHVVDLYEKYSAVFRDIVSQSEALVKSLDAQAVNINQRVASYNQASVVLSSDVEQFNARAARGDFESMAEFAAERQVLESRSNALEQEYAHINQLIAKYNADKEDYDGLAEHLTTLNNSIDSRLAPAPAVD